METKQKTAKSRINSLFFRSFNLRIELGKREKKRSSKKTNFLILDCVFYIYIELCRCYKWLLNSIY